MNNKKTKLSLSTILGAGIILCLVVGALTFIRFNRVSDNTTELLAQKADALFTAIEAGARSGQPRSTRPGMHRPSPSLTTAHGQTITPMPVMPHHSTHATHHVGRFEESLRRILEELHDQPDIRFVAVTNQEGRILAHSDASQVGGALFSPLDMDTLNPSQQINWRMADQETDQGNEQVFLVFREFTPLRGSLPPSSLLPSASFLPPTSFLADNKTKSSEASAGTSGSFRNGTAKEEATQEPEEPEDRRFHPGAAELGLAPVIFVAYDPAPFIRAHKDQERRNLLETSLGIVLGLIGLVLLFWRENNREQKRLIHEATQLSAEKLAAMGSLAAGVAHEIRNPLSSIKGYASIFAQRFPDKSADKEAALAMIRETERLNRAVSDLLSLSAPTKLHPAPCDLKKMLERLMLLIKVEADKQGVSLDSELAAVSLCELDQDKISQAMLNLFLNALQAMPSGGKLSVKLSTRESTQPPWAIISVMDNGCGIAPENLSRIFDPYFTSKADGIGLGLANTQKIIQSHGGRIEVQSNHSGTTFHIYLPL